MNIADFNFIGKGVTDILTDGRTDGWTARLSYALLMDASKKRKEKPSISHRNQINLTGKENHSFSIGFNQESEYLTSVFTE